MENIISNRINMIRATLTWCTNNTAQTSGITAFAGVKSTADNKLVLIDSLTAVADGTTTGVTLDTNQLRTVMVFIALKCGDAVSAYAASVNNNTLRALVTYTQTQMNRLKKEEVDDICVQIHDAANANIGVAGAFGYVATDVTDLFTAIGLYRTSIQNPRQAVITKATAKENIKSISRDIIDNLFKKQMDKMVNTLKAPFPDFVSNYFKARIILDLGSTTAKVRGSIKNVEEIPLQGAHFYITLTGVNEKIAETTAQIGGKYALANILPNDYDLYWEHPFYQTKLESNLHISAGEEVTRNIELEHLAPITGTINSAQLINIFNPTSVPWRIGITIKIKNTSPAASLTAINFYIADTPTEAFNGSNGSTLLPGQEEEHTVNVSDFKPYLNVSNTGPNSGTFEITIL